MKGKGGKGERKKKKEGKGSEMLISYFSMISACHFGFFRVDRLGI